MKKRLLAAILAAAMVFALLPAVALADGESGISLGAGGLKAGDEIYMGVYPDTSTPTYNVPWVVIGSNGHIREALDANPSSLFLISKKLLGDSDFRTVASQGGPGAGYYEGSTLQASMGDLYGEIFTAAEQGIVADTTLGIASMHVNAPNNIPNQKLFALGRSEVIDSLVNLSFYEASLRYAKYIDNNNGYGHWWTRTSYNTTDAFRVHRDGDVTNVSLISNGWHRRPGLNMNTSPILFTSAAVGGKASGDVGADALNANSAPSGTASWKLTLLDSANRSGFSAALNSGSSATVTAGYPVLIDYSGALPGDDEYVSAMIADSDGNVKYYGRIVNNSASGSAQITIPRKLAAGAYTLKVFNEQCNGDYLTDYASAFSDIALEVKSNNVITIEKTGTAGLVDTYTVTYEDGTEQTFTFTNADDGREIELQATATHIQWRYVGDTAWTNLIARSELSGADGVDGKDGTDGADGTDGVGIRSIEKTDSANGVDTHTIYLTNGTSYSFTVEHGKDGNGIAEVKLNEAGDLIVTLSDGSEINAGSVLASAEAFGSAAKTSENNNGFVIPAIILALLLGLGGNAGWIILLMKKKRG